MLRAGNSRKKISGTWGRRSWSCRFPLVCISILSGSICDQSLKLSKIAPISAPANLKGTGPRKKLYPNFGTIFEANHVMFGNVAPTGRKVHLDTLNCVLIFFNFFLLFIFPHFSSEPFRFFWPNFRSYTYFRSCGKVLRRSANEAQRFHA